jgi:hypothetical protein
MVLRRILPMLRTSVATALILVGAAALATAQVGEQPEPADSPEPEESSEAPEPASPTEILVPDVVVPDRPASLWTVSVDLESHYDSNLRFTANELETLSERLTLGITHAKRSGRGTMALNANTWGSVYHEESELNSLNFSGATRGTYAFAPRTRFRGGLSVASTYSPESAILAGEGLILPLSRAFIISSTGGLVQRLGSRTSAGIDARFDRVRFSETEDGLPGPPGGELILLSGSLAPQVSPHDSLFLGYEFQRSDTGSSANGDSQSLSLGWSRIIGTRFTANASAGATRFKLLGSRSAEPGWAVRSSAGFTARFRRSNLTARYDRGIDQAWGFGRDRLGDIVTASYGVTASRRVRFNLLGTYGLTRDPIDPLFRFITQAAAAQMAIAITRRLELSTAYTFRRNSADGEEDVVGHAVGVSLGYSREWRP